ncbi:hypothetical protein ACWDRX_24865, partial [Streptomyces nigra]
GVRVIAPCRRCRYSTPIRSRHTIRSASTIERQDGGQGHSGYLQCSGPPHRQVLKVGQGHE